MTGLTSSAWSTGSRSTSPSCAGPGESAEGPRTAGLQALEFFGTVDILVNNAGIFHRQSLLETTVEQWEETLAVNLRAPFLLAQIVAPGMLAQRHGKIVNVSSLAAVVGCEGMPPTAPPRAQ